MGALGGHRVCAGRPSVADGLPETMKTTPSQLASPSSLSPGRGKRGWGERVRGFGWDSQSRQEGEGAGSTLSGKHSSTLSGWLRRRVRPCEATSTSGRGRSANWRMPGLVGVGCAGRRGHPQGVPLPRIRVRPYLGGLRLACAARMAWARASSSLAAAPRFISRRRGSRDRPTLNTHPPCPARAP